MRQDKEHFQQKCETVLRPGNAARQRAFPAKVWNGFAPRKCVKTKSISSKSVERFCAREMRQDKEHFQQKCETVLRPGNAARQRAFPAKVWNGFAPRKCVKTKSISSKSVKRFCAREMRQDKEHFKQKCETVLRPGNAARQRAFPAKV